MKEINIKKSTSDLKLSEPIDEVYVYMDNNTSVLDARFNNELKLPINLLKIAQKYLDLPIKKVFAQILDVKLKYSVEDKSLNITFWFK